MSTNPVLEGTVVEPPKAVTIFGREPALYLGLIEAVLAAFVVFPLGVKLGLDETFVVLVMAVLSAGVSIWTAIATHNSVLAYLTGAIKAVIALAAYFHFQLSPDQQAVLVAVVAAVVHFAQRTQTSPRVDDVPELGAGAGR